LGLLTEEWRFLITAEDAACAVVILGVLGRSRGMLGLCVGKNKLDAEAGDRIV
jgi:hypothetical protein